MCVSVRSNHPVRPEQVLDDVQDAFERGPQRAPLTEQSLNKGRPRPGQPSGGQGLRPSAGFGSPDHSATSFATSVSSFDTGAAGSVTGAAPMHGHGLGLAPGAVSPLARGKHARAGSLGGGPRSVVQRTDSGSRHGPMQRQGTGSSAGLRRQGSWG